MLFIAWPLSRLRRPTSSEPERVRHGSTDTTLPARTGTWKRFNRYRRRYRSPQSQPDVALSLPWNRVRQEEIPVPPPELRFSVGATTNAAEFLRVGRRCARDIDRALASVGRHLSSFDRCLDFGCGCGRTLRWMAPRRDQAGLFGTDPSALIRRLEELELRLTS